MRLSVKLACSPTVTDASLLCLPTGNSTSRNALSSLVFCVKDKHFCDFLASGTMSWTLRIPIQQIITPGFWEGAHEAEKAGITSPSAFICVVVVPGKTQ